MYRQLIAYFLLASKVFAKHSNHHTAYALHRRDVVAVDPSGDLCPAIAITTTIELQPVYYSEFFPYNTVVDVFRHGAPYSISKAPLTLVVVSHLTRIVIATSTNNAAVTNTLSLNTRAYSTAAGSSSISTGAASVRASITTSVIPSQSQQTDTSSTIPTTPAGPQIQIRSTSSVTFLQDSSKGPQPSISFSTSALPSVSISTEGFTDVGPSSQGGPSSIATPTISVDDLVIGQGLPTGLVSDLPPELFLILAFTDLPQTTSASAMPAAVQQSPQRLHRRQEDQTTAEPVALADLSAPTGQPGTGMPSQDSCDSSTPLILRQGSLLQSNASIAKLPSDTSPVFGFLATPPSNQINITFSLLNGFLSWIAPDVGPATFFNCGGNLFAAFAGDSPPGCRPVLVGAIAGRICSERVQQTRPVEATFTAPSTTRPLESTRFSSGIPSTNFLQTTTVVSLSPSTTSRANIASVSDSSFIEVFATTSTSTSTSTSTITSTSTTNQQPPVSSSPIAPSSQPSSSITAPSISQVISSNSVYTGNSYASESTQPTVTEWTTISVSTTSITTFSSTIPRSFIFSNSTITASSTVASSSLLNNSTVLLSPTTTRTSDSTFISSTTSRNTTLPVPTTTTHPTITNHSGFSSFFNSTTGSSFSTTRIVNSTSTSTSPSTTRTTTYTPSATSTAPCLNELPGACSILSTINGLALLAAVPSCQLELLAYGTQAASCLSAGSITLTTTGNYILSCLANSNVLCSRTTTSSSISMISTTARTTSTPTPSPTMSCQNALPVACAALENLNGLALTGQLDLCRFALGTVGMQASHCLDIIPTVTSTGNSVVMCLVASSGVLCPRSSTSTTAFGTTTRTTSTPTPSPTSSCLNALPGACTSLASQNGLALVSTLPLCSIALAGFQTQSSSCLNIIPTIFTEGSSIVTCLISSGVVCRTITTSTTTSRVPTSSTTSTPTPTPSSNCINNLPASCVSLGNQSGLNLLVPAQQCQAALVSASLQPPSCLSPSNIGLFTTGNQLLACIASSGIICQRASTTTTTTPTPTPSPTPDCVALPLTCAALSNQNGLALITSTALCQSALVSAGVQIPPCLSLANINILTTGTSLVSCITSSGVLCLGRSTTTTTTARATTTATTTTTTSTSTPTSPSYSCLTILPPPCSNLVLLSGLGLISSADTCRSALQSTPNLPPAALIDANTCINALNPLGNPLGSDLVDCLSAAVLC